MTTPGPPPTAKLLAALERIPLSERPGVGPALHSAGASLQDWLLWCEFLAPPAEYPGIATECAATWTTFPDNQRGRNSDAVFKLAEKYGWIPDPPPPPIEWPEPTFDPRIPDQAEYSDVLPDLMHNAAMAITQLAGCPYSMAATAMLPPLATIAALDFRLAGIAPGHRPLMVNAVCGARSGQRKSSIGDHVMKPITANDDDILRRWRAAKSKWYAYNAEDKKANPQDKPTETEPIQVQEDSTIEALAYALTQGQTSQIQYLTELGTVSKGWSGSSSQRGRTYQVYNALWDGRGATIRRARDRQTILVRNRLLSKLIMGQRNPVTDWLLNVEANDGYAARTLLCFQSARADLPPPLSIEERRAQETTLNEYNRILTEAVRSQTVGAEYEKRDDDTRWSIINLDLESYGEFQAHYAYHDECSAIAEDDHDMLMASWHARATEHAQRIAGLFAALRSYQTTGQGQDIAMTVAEARAGIALADWYCDEMQRVGDVTMATEEADDALKIWQTLGEAIRDGNKDIKHDVDGQITANVNRLITQRIRPLRNDPARRHRATQRLEIDGLLQAIPGRKSQWLINPAAK